MSLPRELLLPKIRIVRYTNSTMKPTWILFTCKDPLPLESGASLPFFELAYETYGTLNKKRDNAILICHALSGDSHVAKGGWWGDLVGPKKAIDTLKYFVICSNTLGSCYGSTGPTSVDPATQKPYGLNFPVITIKDMVAAQVKLCEYLDVHFLKAVIGGSMGGMQALEWSISYPSQVKSCIVIATAPTLSPQAVAFGAVGRHAITSDTDWNTGDYYESKQPEKGLAIARMIGHITYLSEESMSKKFGRRLQKKTDYGYDFDTDFEIESYLKHQGKKFVGRFDANSYLYLSKAMSYFDLEKSYKSLGAAFKNTHASFLVMSISSDMLYPAEQNKKVVHTLMRLNKKVSYAEIDSPYGHDAFLIEQEKLGALMAPFLRNQ